MSKLFIITGMLFIFGCKTDSVEKPEPVITIITPTGNQHFVVGDTIRITGTVTHSIALSELAVHMTDLGTNVEFFHNHFNAGNTTTYSFNAKHGITNTTMSTFQLEVEATDINGNAAKKEMMITVN